jgi:hypothetical protein
MSAPIEGSYVAKTMNGREIPADLRLPTTEGDFRLFRLDQAVLHLSTRGHFTLYFRYHHQLVRRGTKPVPTPVMSDSEDGTYTVQSNQLQLTPTKKKGARNRPAISATLRGNEISASYVLQNGARRERLTLVMSRDASFW